MRCLTRGIPITVVSEILGDSHIEITVKRYGRFSSDAKVKWQAMAVLDSPTPTPSEPAPAVEPVPTLEGAPASQPSAVVATAASMSRKPERRLVAIEGGRRGKRAAE